MPKRKKAKAGAAKRADMDAMVKHNLPGPVAKKKRAKARGHQTRSY
jgi:hypothetical protein